MNRIQSQILLLKITFYKLFKKNLEKEGNYGREGLD